MENMATNTATINLEEELTTIRCACAAADAAGRDESSTPLRPAGILFWFVITSVTVSAAGSTSMV